MRWSNYDHNWQWAPAGWRPDTVNYLGRYSREGVTDIHELRDDHREHMVMENGLEDGRMFRWNGRWHCLYSALYQSGGRRIVTRSTMCLMDMQSREYRVLHTGNKREKNWVPIVGEERLLVLYSPENWQVWDLTDGISEVSRGTGLPGWRGGSQFISWRGGYLGVLHRNGTHWGHHSVSHCFAYMDGAFGLVDVSPEFQFFGRGIEFCAGLVAEQDGSLALSFGRNDMRGYILWLTPN